MCTKTARFSTPNIWCMRSRKTNLSELTNRKLFFIAQKYFVKHNWKLNTRRKHDEKSNNYLDVTVLLLEYHA